VAYWSYVGVGRREVTMDRALKKKEVTIVSFS
jgi:hypothetical protein